MKKRCSVDKADYTFNREEFYEKECYNMAYRNKDELLIENETVFIQSEKEKITIVKPLRKKTFGLKLGLI